MRAHRADCRGKAHQRHQGARQITETLSRRCGMGLAIQPSTMIYRMENPPRGLPICYLCDGLKDVSACVRCRALACRLHSGPSGELCRDCENGWKAAVEQMAEDALRREGLVSFAFAGGCMLFALAGTATGRLYPFGAYLAASLLALWIATARATPERRAQKVAEARAAYTKTRPTSYPRKASH